MAKSNIILGSVQFGKTYGINNQFGKPDSDRLRSILNCAYDSGVRIIDSAENYGDALSRIGDYHNSNHRNFEVISKFDPSTYEGERITERIGRNLHLLKLDNFYSYMFHSFEDYRKYYPEFSDELNRLKDKGIVQRIGVSLYTNQEISKVLTFDNLDLIQAPFNLLDNSNKREEAFSCAKKKGMEIHARSVFFQGLFFKDIKSIRGNLIELSPYLMKLKQMEKGDVKIEDLALNYALTRDYIDKVIIGVDSLFQLKSNLSNCNKRIPSKCFDEIDAIKVKELELLNPMNWK
tara:strand:+ start:367 stop:1239 length:873 start_codon:yes stop_codon:yes gene_type:complete